MKLTTLRNLFMAVLLTSLVAGCGWHLRGKGMIPEGLTILYVESNDPDGDLARELARALNSAGVVVPVSSARAQFTLVLLKERSLVRAATVNEQARVSEQQLTEEAEFHIVDPSGTVVVPKSLVSVERIFEYDENNVLATQDERDLIRTEMRRDLINQILNRLRQLKPAIDASES